VALAVLGTVAWAVGRSTISGAVPTPTPTASTLSPTTQDLQQNVISVIHMVQPSVVEISSSGMQGGAIGSGEILTSDGYIVTNNHVVAGFTSYTVALANGQSVPAQIVGTAPEDDLAVLRIHDVHLRPIAVGESRAVQVGQFALAMGSPLGLQQSSTLGIVSAMNREAGEAQGGPLLTGLIQTSAPINPGNSGGALVDLRGRLIGIPTLGATNPENGAAANGIGFAIPSDRMTFITDQLIKYGHVVNSGQGFLGIQGVDVTPELSNYYSLPVSSGVLIVGFTTGASGTSPAQQAGMRRGDIVVQVNDAPISNQADLEGVLLSQAPGTKVSVTVQRGTGQHSVMVRLGERPAGT
jgi:S1-C subfamily serine protease